MTRIFSAIAVAAFAVVATSCCCTSDSEAPPLRPLSSYKEIPAAPMPAQVDYTK